MLQYEMSILSIPYLAASLSITNKVQKYFNIKLLS